MRIDHEKFVGATFGKLTVTRVTGKRNARYEMLVECRCACGGIWVGPLVRLRRGNTLSCGCAQPEVAAKAGVYTRKHGDCATPTYKAHRAMMRRCYDKNNIGYQAYGGAGVTVCDRWRGVENYPNFKADMGERPQGMTLDRYPDQKGNYEPGNCRWATPQQQARNLSTNRWITARGETMILADWANRLGMAATSILDRIGRGWSEEAAVTTPSLARSRRCP